MKELKFDKSVDELVYQATKDKDIIGRQWAMTELSKKTTTDLTKVLAAFNSVAANDSSWMLRRAAITALIQILVPQTTEGDVKIKLDQTTEQTMLKAIKDEKSLVRADALGFLGATGDQKYADIYLAALNDQSYAVLDSAATALGATKSPRAYDALTKLLSQKSWHGRVQIAALRGLSALGDKRALDAGLKYANDKTQPLNVRSASLGIVASAGKGDPRAFPLIFGAFKTALDNNEFQGIFDGVQSIIQLADPRGQEAFDLMKEKFKNNQQFLGYTTYLEAEFKKALAANGKSK